MSTCLLPLAEHNFSGLSGLDLPKAVILAENDGLLADDHQLLGKLPDVQVIKGTDHFFVKREGEVAALVADFLGALVGSG